MASFYSGNPFDILSSNPRLWDNAECYFHQPCFSRRAFVKDRRCLRAFFKKSRPIKLNQAQSSQIKPYFFSPPAASLKFTRPPSRFFLKLS
jgi:hypothetical protein